MGDQEVLMRCCGPSWYLAFRLAIQTAHARLECPASLPGSILEIPRTGLFYHIGVTAALQMLRAALSDSKLLTLQQHSDWWSYYAMQV